MAGEIIRLLTRYPSGASRDPKENRLTAALAALLTESQDLAAGLAQSWSVPQAEPPEDVRIRMQRPVGGHVGWIDLELEVRRPESKVFWVEVKLGHGLSGETQLEKYMGRLTVLYPEAERCLLLLAPGHRRQVFNEIPSLRTRRSPDQSGPFFVSWQEVYRTLAEIPRSDDDPGHIGWLLEEVLGYMEHERLKATALTPAHVQSLATVGDAQASTRSVLERAEQAIEENSWACINRRDKGDNYWEYKLERSVTTLAPVRSEATFSWGVMPPDVFAGVYFRRSAPYGPITPEEDDAWHTVLALETAHTGEDAWEIDDESDRNLVWIGRTIPLTAIVARGESIETQSDAISEFVINALSELSARRATGRA